MIGIYQIENKNNGKIYIGQSVHLKNRIAEHKRKLNKQSHDNKHLQASWLKHGPKAFEFTIKERCTEADLPAKEQFYLDQIPIHLRYNVGIVAASPNLGRKFPQDHRDKISAAQKGNKHWLGKNHSDETKLKMSASRSARHLKTYGIFVVYRIDKQNNRTPIRSDNLANEGFNSGDVYKCCRGTLHTHAGYRWEFGYYITEGLKKLIPKPSTTKPLRKFKKVEKICPNSGIVTEYESAKDAEAEGFNARRIRSAISNQCKYANYFWRFLD